MEHSKIIDTLEMYHQPISCHTLWASCQAGQSHKSLVVPLCGGNNLILFISDVEGSANRFDLYNVSR